MKTYLGLAMIENPNLTVPGPIETVRRTWRERWLSRPWMPWQATKQQQTWLPDPAYYVIEGKQVVGHPLTMAKIYAAIEDMERQERTTQ